jgi:PAS domain S-box-containing protein
MRTGEGGDKDTRLSLILEHMQEVVYQVAVSSDPLAGAVEFVGGRIPEILGIMPDEFLRNPDLWFSLIHPSDVPEVRSSTLQIIESGAPGVRYYRLRHGGTGEYRWMEDRVVPQLDTDGRVVRIFGVARDVTERKQLQAHLVESDRLASVGLLATSVAHEINNPLTYVLLNLQMLEESLGSRPAELPLDEPASPEKLRAWVQDAAEGAGRVREIVRDLRVIGRAGAETSDTSVNGAIDAAIRLAHHELKYRARVVRELDSVRRVAASESRLTQVFLNLLVNAAHAIPEGRKESHTITVRAWQDNGSACVQIRDTGSGISAENLPRLFEAFFTTKPSGIGTGLGLWICRNIVSSYGGSIDVESLLGSGSAFTVRLPTLRPGPPALTVNDPGRVDIPRKRRSILVVDDEANLRHAVAAALRPFHDVVVAASGTQARTILQGGTAFDAIVCDLMMPEVDGVDLCDWLREEKPDLDGRTIIITAGAFTERARKFIERFRGTCLQKPFDIQRLMAAIDDLAGPG